MKELLVKQTNEPRLDRFLTQHYPHIPQGRWHQYLRQNKIKVDNKKQPLNHRLSTGAVVRLYLNDNILLSSPNNLSIVYEDSDVLLIDKPAGLPIDSDDPLADTLINRALKYNSNCTLCHRLDTGTSGLILLAKTQDAYTFLTQLIKERQLQKQYLCVTIGHPTPSNATLKGYLLKDAQKGHVQILTKPVSQAKTIQTQYNTLTTSGRFALLNVTLITGRTHQIRAHLASIGCPIVGDSKYGNNAVNRELRFKYQALCAHSLTFPYIVPEHPYHNLSEKVFYAKEPWYVPQIKQKIIK